jgi:hypothetical protein
LSAGPISVVGWLLIYGVIALCLLAIWGLGLRAAVPALSSLMRRYPELE